MVRLSANQQMSSMPSLPCHCLYRRNVRPRLRCTDDVSNSKPPSGAIAMLGSAAP